ncbi:E3 ubiquitin-protein ligase RNF4-like isoform X1 [Tachypleus tridentatus]|uniref:E3 ubiquitin-protein ligase RNF4-like isoform X1 n=2 Tax=Tachypleus tridentatus TaxID=6853 RepID=UPI003FD03F28
MTSMTVSRRRRRQRVSVIQHTNRAHHRLETVDLCSSPHDLPSCIDLTCEGDEEEIVDLTAVNDSSIVCLGSVPTYLQNQTQVRERNLRALRRHRSRSPVNTRQLTRRPSYLDPHPDYNNDIQHPDYDLGITNDIPGGVEDDSPQRRKITCPVCFDSDTTIQSSYRQLVSTVCGHVFCNSCIYEAIRTTHSCPKCRKKLTLRQYHPIFL